MGNLTSLSFSDSIVVDSHELQGFKPSTTPYYAKPGSVDPRFLLQQQQQQTPLYPDQDRMQQNTPMSMQQNYNTAYPQYLSTIQPLTRPQVANVTNGHGGQVVQAGDKKSSRKGPSGSASTDDDLEIEEEPEVRPAMLSISKPQDERGKVLYEVIDAVWTPRNKPAAPEKVRSGVQVVGDSLRMLRDQWKAQNERLKKAELPQSDTASQAQELKSKTNMYREIMETLVGRITRFGHPSILRRYVTRTHTSHNFPPLHTSSSSYKCPSCHHGCVEGYPVFHLSNLKVVHGCTWSSCDESYDAADINFGVVRRHVYSCTSIHPSSFQFSS